MPYITHADLADSPGALELSQVASDEHRPPVRAELLDAVLRGGDLADWPAEDVADAQRAVGRIDSAVRDAGSMIDGYLAKRGYALPLDELDRHLAEADIVFSATASQQPILHRPQVEAALAARGDEIEVICEFCAQRYEFDRIDAEHLLSEGAAPGAPDTAQ